MVVLVRKENVCVIIGKSAEKAKEIVKEALSIPIDGAYHSPSHVSNGGNWDGKKKLYFERGSYFNFGYGLVFIVKNILEKEGIKCKLRGFDERDVSWVKFSENFLADERDYQRNSIKAFLKRGFGVIKVPTRGGKTFIASELIRLLKEQKSTLKTIFIVDNVDLYGQAAEDISGVTGIPLEDFGYIRGDKIKDGSVIIAMIQTLTSAFYPKMAKGQKTMNQKQKDRLKEIKRILNSINFVIVDEAHEYSSVKRIAVLRYPKKQDWFLSISATPHKDDNKIQEYLLTAIAGDIVYDISEKKLVKRGVLAKNRKALLHFEHEDKNWHSVLSYHEIREKYIYLNKTRNKYLIIVLKVCEELGLKTLAMFNSVEHLDFISKKTGYKKLSGVDLDKKRAKIKSKFLDSKGGVLLVSDIWKKGITLPSVEVFFNVDGGKESSLIIQRRGRVLGVTKEKKKALSFDFIDVSCFYLSEHSLNRIRAYEEKIGKKKIDVFKPQDSKTKVFKEDIKDYLINWFELNIPKDE